MDFLLRIVRRTAGGWSAVHYAIRDMAAARQSCKGRRATHS